VTLKQTVFFVLLNGIAIARKVRSTGDFTLFFVALRSVTDRL